MFAAWCLKELIALLDICSILFHFRGLKASGRTRLLGGRGEGHGQRPGREILGSGEAPPGDLRLVQPQESLSCNQGEWTKT